MEMISRKVSVRGMAIAALLLLNVSVLASAYTENKQWYAVLCITLPVLLLAFWGAVQEKRRHRRHYPLQGLISFLLGSPASRRSLRRRQAKMNRLYLE